MRFSLFTTKRFTVKYNCEIDFDFLLLQNHIKGVKIVFHSLWLWWKVGELPVADLVGGGQEASIFRFHAVFQTILQNCMLATPGRLVHLCGQSWILFWKFRKDPTSPDRTKLRFWNSSYTEVPSPWSNNSGSRERFRLPLEARSRLHIGWSCQQVQPVWLSLCRLVLRQLNGHILDADESTWINLRQICAEP